jgi:AraC-like DNA-binding protein
MDKGRPSALYQFLPRCRRFNSGMHALNGKRNFVSLTKFHPAKIMFSNFLDVLVLLGALQGFIVSGLLFSGREKLLSNRLLGALILLMSLACFNLYLVNQEWFQNNGILQLVHAIVPLVIIMPVGPLIYFYVQSCLDPEFSITRKQKLLFLPVLIDLVPKIAAILYVVGVWTGLIKINNQAWGNFEDNYNTYSDIPRWISTGFYLFLSVKYIRAQRSKPGRDQGKWRWPRQFVFGLSVFQLVWLVHLIPYLIPATSDRLLDLVNWYPLYLPLTMIIYWLSINGYLKAHHQRLTYFKSAKNASALSQETIEQVVPVLKKAMEQDRLYLNPDLNLHGLSQHTGIPTKTVSAVINQHLHKSFAEFVNGYRIQELKEKILQPVNAHLTIAGIAYDCGFNSQPTFHRAFKSITGITPREFLEKNSQTRD